MSSKRVLIVSSHGLFREGLKRVLADVAGLVIIGQVASLPEAEKVARRQKVDAVIVDQADKANSQAGRSETISRLLSLPGTRVITVSLGTDEMWVYRQERVVAVSAEDLVAALTD